MSEQCKFCGREIEINDNISWRFFGYSYICGNCFLPWADYFLKNIEWMEVEERIIRCFPSFYVEA